MFEKTKPLIIQSGFLVRIGQQCRLVTKRQMKRNTHHLGHIIGSSRLLLLLLVMVVLVRFQTTRGQVDVARSRIDRFHWWTVGFQPLLTDARVATGLVLTNHQIDIGTVAFGENLLLQIRGFQRSTRPALLAMSCALDGSRSEQTNFNSSLPAPSSLNLANWGEAPCRRTESNATPDRPSRSQSTEPPPDQWTIANTKWYLFCCTAAAESCSRRFQRIVAAASNRRTGTAKIAGHLVVDLTTHGDRVACSRCRLFDDELVSVVQAGKHARLPNIQATLHRLQIRTPVMFHVVAVSDTLIRVDNAERREPIAAQTWSAVLVVRAKSWKRARPSCGTFRFNNAVDIH
ncbi:hypothetical protein T08_3196 [Trichinella sp. T8]|nr:hypothetical protein T08_3196 [Trichinella sp. T8]